MDETLIHTFDCRETNVGFYKRPFCSEFLKDMAQDFEIYIFTAAA